LQTKYRYLPRPDWRPIEEENMLKKPDHTQQLDFFVAYLVDVPLRDQLDTMERPFFSLSKNKRLNHIEYTSPDGKVWVKVFPNQAFGMATIWDADILIWAISQLVELINRGQTLVPRTIRFHPYDLLKAIGRNPNGKRGYELLRYALRRLAHTAIETNIRAGGLKKTASFHWLDSWREIANERTGKTLMMELTVPDWLYTGILKHTGILSIHPDYFQLTGGLERWLYRVARKHAGMQRNGFFISLPTLHKKSGCESPYRRFKHELRKIVKRDELPEYHTVWIEETESGEPTLHIIRRSKLHYSEPAFRWECKRDRRAPLFEDF
jgi:plasmid replication initiation protein